MIRVDPNSRREAGRERLHVILFCLWWAAVSAVCILTGVWE